MSASPRLGTLDPSDAASLAALEALLEHAATVDGQPAFNDQTRLELKAGTNHMVLAHDGDSLVGAAAVADDTLELVVDPDARGRGVGGALAEHVLTSRTGSVLLRVLEPFVGAFPAPTLAWAHGDHPGARRLAEHHGFEPVRRLLQLRMPLAASQDARTPAETPGVTFDTFDAGRDSADWVALNARVFAGHPEQGKLTETDLAARRAEPWFVADDFLLARDAEGTMVGYNWLKVEEPEQDGTRIGEIYVIGVDSAHAGRGLGRALMERGLARLAARGCTVAALYVEEGNGPAVPLYRSLGFADHTVDVQYARR
ncbi:mycothiol synthase [Subtercola boreus]|uniref:Mycothiol acetyltransferase n=1 Tax=Subtercola boreus TaxID=120213 RepID=A0A3E0VJ47_9MICO|nr:mycothiol synthase [Subtercola boreus]RFA09984.1 mycothiol synthase [Subtercola boreus]TQL52871.1 mycothiol synthase [Subtercola boreus]